ncbi:MAG TPA: tetratricopeptide repeat protein [Chthoniobacterales bacterium]|nr:tetratricopeptide repeat protein [Chthoniobacterales bacterium]
MKTLRFTVPFILLLAVVRPIHAQNILLKTGQTIETKGVRRAGDMVMAKIQVGASSGEVGYQAATIAKIDFPEPPQLKTTAAFLSEGQPEKALADIEPVVKYYTPLRDLPGNWWAQAALLKIGALGGMQLDKPAEALGDELRQRAVDPETARAAQLQLVAGLLRKEDYAKALRLCDAVIKDSAKPEVLAEAWVRKGDALLAQRQWDGAVLAYLHVAVFYEDEKLWMPPALLGRARAFRGLDDVERAKRSLDDLTAGYPKSAQAEIARTELQRLPK